MEHKKEYRKIEPKRMENGIIAESSKEYYPEFRIDLMHLPEAKDWELGKEYYISLKLRQTSMDLHKNKKDKEMGYIGFDIIGIKIENNKWPDKKEKRYT